MLRLRRQNKYSAKMVRDDGIVFRSQLEYRRYKDLKLMQTAGVISGLKVHPRYPIVYEGDKVCIVELDFEYNLADGKPVYEDTKGFYDPYSKLKHKLFKAFYGQGVTIVKG